MLAVLSTGDPLLTGPIIQRPVLGESGGQGGRGRPSKVGKYSGSVRNKEQARENSTHVLKFSLRGYYAPPRGPKGRGVAPIGATRGVHYIVFSQELWLLYALGLYT